MQSADFNTLFLSMLKCILDKFLQFSRRWNYLISFTFGRSVKFDRRIPRTLLKEKFFFLRNGYAKIVKVFLFILPKCATHFQRVYLLKCCVKQGLYRTVFYFLFCSSLKQKHRACTFENERIFWN